MSDNMPENAEVRLISRSGKQLHAFDKNGRFTTDCSDLINAKAELVLRSTSWSTQTEYILTKDLVSLNLGSHTKLSADFSGVNQVEYLV